MKYIEPFKANENETKPVGDLLFYKPLQNENLIKDMLRK